MPADPETTEKPAVQGPSRSPRAEAILGSAPDEQIAAAVAAEKWARAIDLLELHGERLLLDGGVGPLSAWLEAIPEDLVGRHAKLAALTAWVRIYEQRYQDALKCLSKAERALQQLRLSGEREVHAGDDEVELRPHAELESSLAAIRLHLQAVVGGGKLPTQVEEIMIPASGDHPLWRAAALVILGRSRFLAGDLKGAGDDVETAHVLASSTRGQRAGRVEAEAAVLLGRIAEARGKLAAAEKRYVEVLTPKDGALQPRLAAEVGLARLALQRLDAPTAAARLQAVKTALGQCEEAPDPIRVVLEGELARTWLAMLEGRSEEARATLDQLEKTLPGLKLRWPLGLVLAHRARLALLRKDEAGARRWLQQYAMRAESGQTPQSPLAAFEEVTEALVQAALHAPALALKAAQGALAFAEATGNRAILAEAQVALALGHYGAGARDDAKAALVAALETTRSMGALLPLYVRGLDTLADELGVVSDEIARAAALLPPVTVGQRTGIDRPAGRPAHGSGPIETAQRVEPTHAEAAIEPVGDGEVGQPAAVEAPSGEGTGAAR